MDSISIPDNGRLSNAETGNEATSINRSKVAINAADHEDDDSKDPERAEEPSGLDTADSIANDKGPSDS